MFQTLKMVAIAIFALLTGTQSIAQTTLPANHSQEEIFCFVLPTVPTENTIRITASGLIKFSGWAPPCGPSGTAGNGWTDFREYNVLPGVPHAGLLSVQKNGEFKAASRIISTAAVTFNADILTVTDSLTVMDDSSEIVVLSKGIRLLVLTVNDQDPTNNSGEWKLVGLPASTKRYLMQSGDLGLLQE